jgi:hypothetical protein
MKHWTIGPNLHRVGSAQAVPPMTRNGVNVCPQAWHLQRRGTARSVAGARSVEHGIAAHHQIGTRADRVIRLERVRRAVLLLIAILLIGLLFLFLSGHGLR